MDRSIAVGYITMATYIFELYTPAAHKNDRLSSYMSARPFKCYHKMYYCILQQMSFLRKYNEEFILGFLILENLKLIL